jgi:hypothetical protein
MMTENMKIWLKELYLNAAKEHRGAASNERLWALGSDNEEQMMRHEINAAENMDFADILTDMANKI